MKNSFALSICMSCLLAASGVRADVVSIGEGQRSGLGVTLYSNGTALIEDARVAQLPLGNNILEFSSVSPQMLAESAQLIADPAFAVIEQGFLPANLSQTELLKAYLGKSVKVVKTHPTTGEDSVHDALVIAAVPQLMLRIDGQIETTVPGRLVFPVIPASLRANPVFRAVGQANAAARTTLRLQYLAAGLSWQADHVATFDETSGRLQLQTWATLVNTSGLDLISSRMQLVAGQVNQLTSPSAPRPLQRLLKAESMAMADTAAPPSRQSLEGYHLYSLNRPVDLFDNQRKQIPLLPLQQLPAKRQLVGSFQPNMYGQDASSQPSHPQIQITFTNDGAGGAKQPLPGGIIRLYGADQQQVTQFLGEDRLDNLPVGERAEIAVGQAFDVTIRHKQVDFKREVMGRNSFEVAFTVEVLNGSERTETVKVNELITGDWSFAEDKTAFVRDGNQAVWEVEVPAGGTVTAGYRVRLRR